jgi:hypothetical protein
MQRNVNIFNITEEEACKLLKRLESLSLNNPEAIPFEEDEPEKLSKRQLEGMSESGGSNHEQIHVFKLY